MSQLKLDQEDKNSLNHMVLKYQDRLNYWGDDDLEQCNPLARSGVFGISKIQNQFSREFVNYRVVGGGEVAYQGWKLSVFDEDVYLLLMYFMRGQSLLKPLKIKKSQILHELGLNLSGSNYNKIDKSLERLSSAQLKISSPTALEKMVLMLSNPKINQQIDDIFLFELAQRYGQYIEDIQKSLKFGGSYNLHVRFISNYGDSPEAKELTISLDPLMVLFFDGINTVRINRYERSLLSPAEKKLLAFFQSHKAKVYDLNLESYADILRSETQFNNPSSVRKFVANMRKWIGTLEKLGKIKPGWSVDKNKVRGIETRSVNEILTNN